MPDNPGREVGQGAVAMFGLLMFVAVVAIVVSNRANTANILTEIGKQTGSVINAAVSPVTANK